MKEDHLSYTCLLIRILEIMISSNFEFGPNVNLVRLYTWPEKRFGYHLFKNATNWLNSYLSYLEYLFLLQEL